MDSLHKNADLGRPGPAPDTQVAMHKCMLRIRRVEEAIAKRYAQQEMRCPTHLCIGQEGVPAAFGALAERNDKFYSAHRSHGHYLAKGGDLRAMLAELHGRETGCARGRGGSQHLIDLDAGFVASAPILAGTVPIAVGTAMSIKWRRLASVVVVFFGDGAIEEGACHESMNFASVHALPVIFVCENNLYSVATPMAARQPAGRQIADIAKAHALASGSADGNDVDAAWGLAREAVARARSGDGPSLLEFSTYRWLEHCGPSEDVKQGYRSAEEIALWQSRCPIVLSQRRLSAAGLLSSQALAELEAEISAEIDAAFAFARSSPFPNGANFGDFVFPDRG